MEKIEEAARAAFAVIHPPSVNFGYDSREANTRSEYMGIPVPSLVDQAHDVVRAVLSALLPPSEAMVVAGQATECPHGEMNCGAEAAFTAMINAALGNEAM